MLEEKINKAISFFRKFSNMSDKKLYRDCVLKFCDAVEEYMKKPEKPDLFEEAKDLFKEEGGD